MSKVVLKSKVDRDTGEILAYEKNIKAVTKRAYINVFVGLWGVTWKNNFLRIILNGYNIYEGYSKEKKQINFS